jgi:hypothetical protein
MLKLKPNLYPSGGYVFRDSDGVKFTGNNWNAVIRALKEYRTRNKKPPGDPVREITEQACSNQPSLCFDDQGRAAPPIQVSLKAKALKWLYEFHKRLESEKLAFVTTEEAASRAAICRGCPSNVSMGVSGCSSCKQSFTEFRKNILGGARVQHSGVKGCGVLGVDLITAVHLDEIRVDNPNLPVNCWRKKAL